MLVKIVLRDIQNTRSSVIHFRGGKNVRLVEKSTLICAVHYQKMKHSSEVCSLPNHVRARKVCAQSGCIEFQLL